MKALLIEFDPITGKRPGNINPNDPGLQCYGWQRLDTRPAKEIRIIEDDRDVNQYKGIKGVKILNGKDEINKAIDELGIERYKVENPIIFQMHLMEKGIKIDKVKGRTGQEILKELYNRGIKGIIRITPPKL